MQTNVQSTCIEELVSVPGCVSSTPTILKITDLEGVTMEKLSAIASPEQLTGVGLAADLKSTAARLMLGDLQMIPKHGYTIEEVFGELCSSCDYSPVYMQAGGGVAASKLVISKFSVLNIHSLQILCEAQGETVLILDDGETKVKKTFQAEGSNTISNIKIKYSTSKNSVKIYLEDLSIKTSLIVCEKKSSCGCGGGATNDDYTVSFSGLLNGMEAINQYGFKVCASVSCSSDILFCSLIKSNPNIFGLTYLYRIGIQFYATALGSIRNNRVKGLNEEYFVDMQERYEGLYKDKMIGTKNDRGISNVVNSYLSQNKDMCVKCNSVVKTAYTTG